ncbi:hypothetical protein AB0H18_39315 [Streptomyces sp. NPDC020766]
MIRVRNGRLRFTVYVPALTVARLGLFVAATHQLRREIVSS